MIVFLLFYQPNIHINYACFVSYVRSLMVKVFHRHRKGVALIPAGGSIVDKFCLNCFRLEFRHMSSGGARSRNLGGGHLRGNMHFGGQDRISRNLPSPLVAKIFDPLDFFPYIFSEIFSRTFLIYFQTFKNCPGLPKIVLAYQKFFPDLSNIS